MNRQPAIVAILAAAAFMAGCQQYTARQELIEPYTGNAVAHNLALQAADPWPPYVYDDQIPTNGQRQADAYMRYQKQHAEVEAQPLAPIQLVVPQN